MFSFSAITWLILSIMTVASYKIRSFIIAAILCIELSNSGTLNAEYRKLYDNIKSGRGLYGEEDKVTVLNSTNFKTKVFGNNRAWIVEFYNSWCGFCHRFAPLWRSLAVDMQDWNTVIMIAAVDCSSDENNPLCREYEIMYYPMLKFFPANSQLGYLGQEVKKGKNIQEIRKSFVDILIKEQTEGRGAGWPNIIPYRSIDVKNLWKNVPESVKYTFLIFEDNDSKVGVEVILDLCTVKQSQIRRVLSENEPLLKLVGVSVTPNLVALQRDTSVITLKVSDNSRAAFRKAIKEFLISNGISVPEEKNFIDPGEWSNVKAPDLIGIMSAAEEEKKAKKLQSLGDVIFQVDLEKTVLYALKHEVASHKILSGNAMKALQNYLTVLCKYFPISDSGLQFLKDLRKRMFEVVEITGENFLSTFKQFERERGHVFSVSENQDWVGCMGSKPHYRGFPCGMWMLYHTLTVVSVMESGNERHFDNLEVLNAMLGYVTHFFGCQDCSNHFQEMAAQSLEFEVLQPEDSILWLWKSHNKVNKRLEGDMTEDPIHPKYQFPSKESCPECRYLDDSWNELEVLKYLKKMYGRQNISFMGISGSSGIQESIKQNNQLLENNKNANDISFVDFPKEEQGSGKRSGWNFNSFDISICVVLYMFSSILLFVLCVKFVIRRKYRKKSYIHDLFGKV